MDEGGRLVTEADFAAALEQLEQADVLTVDLETSGLNPYRGHRLIGVAVAADGRGPSFYFPYRHRAGTNLPLDRLHPLLDLLVSGKALVGHNLLGFDCLMLAAEGERYATALLADDRILKADTLVDAVLVDETIPHDLESLAARYLGAAAEKPRQKAALLAAATAALGKAKGAQAMGRLQELPPELVAPYATAGELGGVATRPARRVPR